MTLAETIATLEACKPGRLDYVKIERPLLLALLRLYEAVEADDLCQICMSDHGPGKHFEGCQMIELRKQFSKVSGE